MAAILDLRLWWPWNVKNNHFNEFVVIYLVKNEVLHKNIGLIFEKLENIQFQNESRHVYFPQKWALSPCVTFSAVKRVEADSEGRGLFHNQACRAPKVLTDLNTSKHYEDP